MSVSSMTIDDRRLGVRPERSTSWCSTRTINVLVYEQWVDATEFDQVARRAALRMMACPIA
eukprot:7520471-Heterocapsa_arctica.AAC.1